VFYCVGRYGCLEPLMLITLSRLYPDGARARAVVEELKAAGLSEDDIGIIAPSRDGVGLRAGLGAFVLPGIGAVVAAGWLASGLAGAVAGGAAGGIVGALVETGISDNDAGRFADGIKTGGTLVTIRVMDQDRAYYSEILDSFRARPTVANDAAGVPLRGTAPLHLKHS